MKNKLAIAGMAFLSLIFILTFASAVDYSNTINPIVTQTGTATGVAGTSALFYDNNPTTFYGVGENQHHGGWVNLSIVYNFPTAVNLQSINYSRGMITSGSSSDNEKQIEQVIITNSSGRTIVYNRNTVVLQLNPVNNSINGPFNGVTKVEFSFFARSSGGSSDRHTRIRLYDLSLSGTNQTDGDNDDDDDDNETLRISNLYIKSKGTNYITWGWRNPTSSNFKENWVYIDNTRVAVTTNNYYRAANLESDTEYTIKVISINMQGNGGPAVTDTERTRKTSNSDDDEDNEDNENCGTTNTESNSVTLSSGNQAASDSQNSRVTYLSTPTNYTSSTTQNSGNSNKSYFWVNLLLAILIILILLAIFVILKR